MATTKITSPDLFDLGSLNTALKLPSGTTAERPTSPSTGEWRYNTTTNLVEFWDGGEWRDLQSENIPPINSENFNTVLYNGTGSAQSITGVGFKPDLVWIKERAGSAWHSWFDTTRGVGNRISSNSINAQNFDIQRLSAFDADGFSLGTDGDVNGSGKTFVAWCWKVGGGTTSSNTEGTITSTVQANTKAAFSIVKFVGTGANATVGHGLGTTPEIIIFKSSTAISGWKMFTNQTSDPANQVMELSDPNGVAARADAFNATLPTSTLFSLGTYSDVNNNGNDMMAYCFASVAGYSSIGSYTGNGSTNGPIVNTGFEPAFVIIKRTDSADNWILLDNKRSTSNPRINALFPNLDNVELTSGFSTDFLTNGFQLKTSDNSMNSNGGTYLYIAFGSDASAAPALPDSFANKLYAGTGSPQSISGLGFSPSLVWLKSRNEVNKNVWTDSVRGANKQLFSDSTDAESTSTDRITSFDSDGFTLNSGGSFNRTNNSGTNYVAWNWKANPITTINTDGTIQSIVSANQAAGFSIVKYVGNGSSGSTIGHGLSAAPEVIIGKNLQNTTAWGVYVKDNVGSSGNPASERLTLQTSDATTTTTAYWGGTEPTSSVFTVGTENAVNQSGYNTIAYCFTSISGFSSIGTYTGNGSTQSITGVGFEPNWIMFKKTSAAQDWLVVDSARGGQKELVPNNDTAEYTMSNGVSSFDSDGWTMGANNSLNTNGESYIYMAFKENPAQYAIPSGEMGYLVAAGGGSGYYSQGAGGVGGGGAGGFRTTYGLTSGGGASAETNLTLATGTYTVTVGAGGAMVASAGNDGSDSSITGVSSITTVGGGGGAGGNAAGAAGGSGSGAGENYGTALAGGAGTANQGFAGGTSVLSSGGNAAGGGGASAVGGNNSITVAGNGGAGITSAITGSNVGYAGGGGGSAYQASSSGGLGTHGGGNGTLNGIRTSSTAGGINTGGGGGALGGSIGAAGYTTGGSGVVVLRMNTSDFSGTTSGSPTISAIGSETILQYLASGSYTHNPSTASGTMNYMVLSGGASGASNGGGGGSGGLRSSWYASGGGAGGETPLTLSSGTYTITIGAGGAEVTTYQDPGNDGTATTISGNATVNTVGGGGGGSNNTPVGRNGGAGGGGGATPGTPSNGGTGTAGEGFDGGRAGAVNQPYAGAGGGGTGAVGQANGASAAGAGGDGLALGITGALVNYGGGGGGSGGTATGGLSGGAGGAGGGGAGGAWNSTGIAGTVNTGGGGGGSGDNTGVGGAGGSGKVILRLITSEYSGTTTGSPTVTTVGTDTVLTFTGSGTYVHS